MTRNLPLIFSFAFWLYVSAAANQRSVPADDQTRTAVLLPKVRVAPEGRTFQRADGKPFVPMGVNYYRPGTGWAPQLWKKFDPDATRQDFARMKELGVNCVRVFLTYGSFFTEPDALDAEGLAKLDQFLRIAEEAGIYVHPTGPDHWEGVPDWARRGGFADEPSLSALETFWKLLASRYRGRSVIFAYDLRNEPTVPWDTPAIRARWNEWLRSRYGSAVELAAAWRVETKSIRWGDQAPPPPDELGTRPLLEYQHFREDIADQWTRRQAAAIKTADPEAMVTVGLIQWSVPAVLPTVQHYSAFRPQRQSPFLDFMEIHFYPLATGFFEYSEEDEERNLAYLEVVASQAAAPGKPVVIAEFGWYGGGSPTIGGRVRRAAGEKEQARWCRRAVETTQGLATGWLNWGFYDQPEARDVSQLTGLLTADGKPKAWAREFQRLAGKLSHEPLHRAAPRSPVHRYKLGLRPVLDWDRLIVDPKAGREFLKQYTKMLQ